MTAYVDSVWGLPEAQRKTALMDYAQSYTYAEAAAALGVPIGAVSGDWHSANETQVVEAT